MSVTPGGERTTWTWDYENLATVNSSPTNGIQTMSYNADNRRVQILDGDSHVIGRFKTSQGWALQNQPVSG